MYPPRNMELTLQRNSRTHYENIVHAEKGWFVNIEESWYSLTQNTWLFMNKSAKRASVPLTCHWTHLDETTDHTRRYATGTTKSAHPYLKENKTNCDNRQSREHSQQLYIDQVGDFRRNLNFIWRVNFVCCFNFQHLIQELNLISHFI
jgi:hypothetical protein